MKYRYFLCLGYRIRGRLSRTRSSNFQAGNDVVFVCMICPLYFQNLVTINGIINHEKDYETYQRY